MKPLTPAQHIALQALEMLALGALMTTIMVELPYFTSGHYTWQEIIIGLITFFIATLIKGLPGLLSDPRVIQGEKDTFAELSGPGPAAPEPQPITLDYSHSKTTSAQTLPVTGAETQPLAQDK